MEIDKQFLNDMVSSKGKAKTQPNTQEEVDEKEQKMKEFASREKERILEEKANDEEIKKINLAKKIRQYYEAFPFVTTCAPKQKLEKMSLIQLEMEMQRIIAALNAKSALQTVRGIDYAINFGIEKILIKNNVPAAGLAEFSRSEEGLQMMEQEHREFALEYQDFFGQSKEFRYLMKSFGRIMLIIDMNKKNMGESFTNEEEKEFENL